MNLEKDRNTFQRAWRRLKNRGSRNLRDGGVIIGSSAVTIRLRSFGRQHSVPNLVVEDSEGNLALQGENAREIQGRTPENLTVERPFVGGRVVNIDSCKKLLQKLFKGSRHGVIFGPRLLVGVPSRLSKLERRTVKEVLKATGARKVDLLDCALMNVIGAGRDPSTVEGHLVVDLGAGSGEVVLVSRGEVQSHKTVPEIGRRMDKAIQASLESEYNIVISLAAAENLKRRLGTALEPQERVTTTVYGRDSRTGLPCGREVDNLGVYQALLPTIDELTEEVRHLLKSISPGFTADIAEKGILLVGGVANLPGLGERIEDFTGVKVECGENPELLTQNGLDELLLSPKLRKELLQRGPVEGWSRRSKGRTGKIGGALAVALLLVASLFPINKMDGYELVDSWKTTLAPLVSSFQRADEEAIASRYESRLAEKERQLQILSEKNKQLSSDNSEQPLWGGETSLTADVIARPPGSWQESLVINQGSNDGVSSGMVVTNGDGLVGVVDRADPESAHVKLLGSRAEPLGGKVARTETHGVISAKSGQQITMTYLDPNEGVRLGDIVTTSGLDGQFPAGVPVGEVVSLEQPSGKSYLVAQIEPVAELDSLESVLMLGKTKTHRI